MEAALLTCRKESRHLELSTAKRTSLLEARVVEERQKGEEQHGMRKQAEQVLELLRAEVMMVTMGGDLKMMRMMRMVMIVDDNI